MARSVYDRTAQRGFPVFDASGTQTGAGHLQDVTRLPDRAGVAVPGQPYPHNDPANTPAQLAPPQEFILGLQLWGLPASPRLDSTPHGIEYDTRTPGDIGPGGVSAVVKDPSLDPYPQGPYHDAPLMNPGQPVNGRIRSHSIGFQGRISQDHVGPVEGNGESAQEADAKGSLRGNSGFDAVQGYGGGGKGAGGTNLPQLTTETRNYPGTFYAHDAFTSAAEVPHLDAEASQFIQSQPGMAPWTGGMFSFPLAGTHAQDIIPADVPLQGPPVAASSGGLLPPAWG